MTRNSRWWRERAKATAEQPSASLLTFLQSKEGERAVLNVLANNAAVVRTSVRNINAFDIDAIRDFMCEASPARKPD